MENENILDKIATRNQLMKTCKITLSTLLEYIYNGRCAILTSPYEENNFKNHDYFVCNNTCIGFFKALLERVDDCKKREYNVIPILGNVDNICSLYQNSCIYNNDKFINFNQSKNDKTTQVCDLAAMETFFNRS